MPTYIAIAVLVLLFIGVVIRSIDWRDVAVKWVGNNPENAQIYIKYGSDIKTLQGKRGETVEGRQQYLYKEHKKNKIVVLPEFYPYEFIRGRRVIGIQDEQVVPNPLGWWDEETTGKVRESQGEMGAWSMGDQFVRAIKSVKRQGATNWMTFVIVGIVVVAGYFIYTNVIQPKDVEPEPNIPANVEPVRPTPIEPDSTVIINQGD